MANPYIILPLAVAVLLTLSPCVKAAHPLITDDSGTEGKNHLQFELNNELSRDGAQDAGEHSITVAYGIHESADFLFTVPYLVSRVRDPRPVQMDSGIGDIGFELKWRYWERDGWSLAARPGATVMSGNEDRGFGSGRAGYSFFSILSRESGPTALHLNLGYIGNENKLDERVNLWHASIAAGYELVEGLQAVVDFRGQGNPDKTNRQSPVAFVGGLIYSLHENLDLDVGYKTGLNAAEAGDAILFGLAYRL